MPLSWPKEAGLQICLDMASYNIVANDLEFFSLLINKYVDIVLQTREEAKAFTGERTGRSIGAIARNVALLL